jgi:hypothetical protein
MIQECLPKSYHDFFKEGSGRHLTVILICDSVRVEEVVLNRPPPIFFSSKTPSKLRKSGSKKLFDYSRILKMLMYLEIVVLLPL